MSKNLKSSGVAKGAVNGLLWKTRIDIIAPDAVGINSFFIFFIVLSCSLLSVLSYC